MNEPKKGHSRFGNLGEAVRASGFFVGLGLIFAAGFFLLSVVSNHLAKQSELWHYSEIILEHLGMGFLVASIAVFFYEWGSHEKELLEHSRELLAVHRDLLELKQQKVDDCLNRSLSELLGPGPMAEQIKESIRRVVVNISQIQSSAAWDLDGELNCLSSSLSQVADNAQTLASINNPSPSVIRYPYTLEGMKQGADLLRVLVESLQPGDFYGVISHIESWTLEELDKLHDSSRSAAERGVKVVRIFNLLTDCSHLRSEMVKEVLQRHIKLAENDNYEVYVFLPEDIKTERDLSLGRRVREKQQAFFESHGGNRFLHIEIRSPTLSEMELTASSTRYIKSRETFNKIIGISTLLNEKAIESCISAIYSKERRSGLAFYIIQSRYGVGEAPNPGSSADV